MRALSLVFLGLLACNTNVRPGVVDVSVRELSGRRYELDAVGNHTASDALMRKDLAIWATRQCNGYAVVSDIEEGPDRFRTGMNRIKRRKMVIECPASDASPIADLPE